MLITAGPNGYELLVSVSLLFLLLVAPSWRYGCSTVLLAGTMPWVHASLGFLLERRRQLATATVALLLY